MKPNISTRLAQRLIIPAVSKIIQLMVDLDSCQMCHTLHGRVFMVPLTRFLGRVRCVRTNSTLYSHVRGFVKPTLGLVSNWPPWPAYVTIVLEDTIHHATNETVVTPADNTIIRFCIYNTWKKGNHWFHQFNVTSSKADLIRHQQ